ncbi:DUF2510 domain-containing protein [Sanguibacter hominis ATCC BAA-789]|uniref:DUF2510 domain-containing protein n=1 Tax=Sanguibacter hominis ATCC BAA-789 TaxID=1312740 RepID=A0A9X5FFH9_9MICO|nr:DUF2510 domain-containing protein [Sanguibacter hominis]NKX93136.1 DUF2510 domain-containing protein [Sanguibacter hominis ATCC BAA-789]
MSETFAARGWHDDPSNPDRERYSDGTRWAASRRRPGTLSGVPFFTWAIGLLVGSLVLSLVASAIDSPTLLSASGVSSIAALVVALCGARAMAVQVDATWRASARVDAPAGASETAEAR